MGRDAIEAVVIIAVSGGVAVMLLMTLGFMTWLLRKGGGRKRSRAEEAEETEMIQEIYHGMSKMADRVEALETLLLHDDRSKRSDFDRELRQG